MRTSSLRYVSTDDRCEKVCSFKNVTWLTYLDVGTNRICTKASKTSMLKYPAGARDLNIGLSPHLYPYCMYARIEGSNLCRSETPKRLSLQTVRSQMKSHKTWRFVSTGSVERIQRGGGAGGPDPL